MADSSDHYRGYEIALYWRGRQDVRVQIRGSGGLPPIHDMPLEKSVEEARRAAQGLIDRKLAARPSN